MITLEKKMMSKLVAFHSCKKLQVLETNFFEKKSFHVICVERTSFFKSFFSFFKAVRGIFLKIDRSRDILAFGYFTVSKIVLHGKTINKCEQRKIKKIPRTVFGDNCFANHLVKILPDRIKHCKGGALRVSID